MSIKVKKTKKQTVSASKSIKNSGKYTDATDSITAAIYALGDSAKSGDILARESIANLSVILFELQ